MDFTLDDSIGFIIECTEQCLKRELRKSFQAHGFDVTPYQWVVLYRLWEQEGLTQAEIAERTIKDKPTITRMVDVLEKKGLVVRRNDENDRRVYKIYLTEEGKMLEQELVPVVEAHIAKALQGIAPDKVESAKRLLLTICRNF
jgi:DNA-binding MarR family transcriptional regulator